MFTQCVAKTSGDSTAVLFGSTLFVREASKTFQQMTKQLAFEPPYGVILTSVDSDEPVQLPFKHINSK